MNQEARLSRRCWRQARDDEGDTNGATFAPVLVESVLLNPAAAIAPYRGGGVALIEIMIGAATVRVSPGIDVATLTTALRAVEGGDMIAVPAGVRVLVATKPVDFRRGADSLAALAREELQRDPFSGTIFVFRSKRADRLKILAWDGSGLVLFWKRLEQNAFRWPPISDGVMRLSASQLAALVDGLDWSRLHAQDIPRPEAAS